MTTPFVLGVIPARGGSKGIPRKNLCLLAGVPLIVHAINAAKASRRLSDFLVSTEDQEIASTARLAGALVPFMRPRALADDKADAIGVVRHAVFEYERLKGVLVDLIVILQPTAPLRQASDIDGALEMMAKHQGAKSLASCCDVGPWHPSVMYKQIGNDRMTPLMADASLAQRRQDFDPVFIRNGAIYICTRQLAMEQGQIRESEPLCYVMPRERSVNIDEPLDLRLAELLCALA